MAQKILIVEDNIHIQGYAKTVLENAGYVIIACGTAAEARKSFWQSRPDLVIVDIGLPDGNGLDLVRELRGPDADVAFMFLTASSDLQTRLECFRLGAMDYIPKPFAVEELLARVQMHLKLKQNRDKLARRNYELELRHRARRDLTDMIVHDLKAPLTSIKGTLELTLRHGLISDAAYQNLLVSAGTAADFMLLMLNDLLDIGQAEQAGLKPEIAPAELELLVSRLRSLFQGHCRTRGVTIEARIAPQVAKINTDANLVFRILVNLVSNALKVSSRGQVVSIEALARDGQARLVVSDCGPGVPDSRKLSIFEKYTTGAPRQGTGIGLTFCTVASQALGGKIHVEDRPGGGSLFIVDLPRIGAGAA
jgi:two-component system sensor histidine kinase/response regulator